MCLTLFLDFDKAVTILEKKLEARDSPPAGRGRTISPSRQQSVQFHIVKEPTESDVMIDPTMLLKQDNIAIAPPSRSPSSNMRRQNSMNSITSNSPENSGIRHSNLSTTGAGSAGTSVSHSVAKDKDREQFPTGAQVPAAYYKEIEEQLADALYKRTQAKLMADPDQVNVESALVDALRVNALFPI